MHVLAAVSDSTTSWAIGYTIAIIVVLVVVALVVPILLLARSIGQEAGKINESLQVAVRNTCGPGRAERDERVRRGDRRRAPAWTIQVGRLTMIALTSTQENLWWRAVIGGLVVVLAVAALLTILVMLVRTIDRRVVEIRATLEQAAANTADGPDRGESRPASMPSSPGLEPPVPRSRPREGPLGRPPVLSVIVIVLLIAVLAFYLYVVGEQLTRIATNLEECTEIAGTIVRNAEVIVPGVEHINRTGGVVAGALPLLYGMAEGIVSGATYQPPRRPIADRHGRPRASSLTLPRRHRLSPGRRGADSAERPAAPEPNLPA